MKLSEYQTKATKELNTSIKYCRKERMYAACFGITEEIGEFTAEIRKPLFKGNFHQRKFGIDSFCDELGDVFWNLALISDYFGIDMEYLQEGEKELEIRQVEHNREKIEQLAMRIITYVSPLIRSIEAEFYEKGSQKEEALRQMQGIYIHIKELADMFNLTIEDALDKNLEKVSARYPSKKVGEGKDEK